MSKTNNTNIPTLTPEAIDLYHKTMRRLVEEEEKEYMYH